MKEAIFKNSRVYCKFSHHVSDQELFLKLATTVLAFIAYWGIVLFGYDT